MHRAYTTAETGVMLHEYKAVLQSEVYSISRRRVVLRRVLSEAESLLRQNGVKLNWAYTDEERSETKMHFIPISTSIYNLSL